MDLTRACLSRADVTDWLVSGYIELKKQAQETSDVPVMEEELSSRKKALDNIMKAIEAGIFNETTSARMQELETEIHDLERSIALGKAMVEEPVDGERMRFYLEKLRNGTPDNQAYRKELLRTMVKAIRLWDDRIEIEYNFTGTDGDGNNYRVVTEFLKGDSGSVSGVHTEPPQPHHTIINRHSSVFAAGRKRSCAILLIIDNYLAGFHCGKGGAVAFRRDAGAAGCVHMHFDLWQKRLDEQGVGDDAYFRAQPHERDAADRLAHIRHGQQLAEGITAESGLVNWRLGAQRLHLRA